MLRTCLLVCAALHAAAAPVILERGDGWAEKDLEAGAFATLRVRVKGDDSPVTWHLQGGGLIKAKQHGKEALVQYRAPRAGGTQARVVATALHDPSQTVAFTLRVKPNPEPEPPAKVDLLPFIKHVPAERDQGGCHDCYAWATTAALETELGVKYGLRERLSIAFFHEIYDPGLPGAAPDVCMPNNVEVAVATYLKRRELMPWDQFGLSRREFGEPMPDLWPSPCHGIQDLTLHPMPTDLWQDEDVIADLKARLARGKAVIFRSGGHYVTIMGYDASDPDPAKHAWRILDSRGVRPDRPDATYRQAMRPFDYNFESHDGNPEFTFEWLDLTAQLSPKAGAPPPATLQPNLQGLARLAAAYGAWRLDARYQPGADRDLDGFVGPQDALSFLAEWDAQP